MPGKPALVSADETLLFGTVTHGASVPMIMCWLYSLFEAVKHGCFLYVCFYLFHFHQHEYQWVTLLSARYSWAEHNTTHILLTLPARSLYAAGKRYLSHLFASLRSWFVRFSARLRNSKLSDMDYEAGVVWSRLECQAIGWLVEIALFRTLERHLRLLRDGLMSIEVIKTG